MKTLYQYKPMRRKVRKLIGLAARDRVPFPLFAIHPEEPDMAEWYRIMMTMCDRHFTVTHTTKDDHQVWTIARNTCS